MKIDKTKPSHWLCLLLFGLNVLAAMALRPLCHRRRRRHVVILYGHKLAGNLLAIHRYVQAHASDEFELAFLTMDKRYGRALLLDGVNAVIATRPEALRLLIRADAVISDHGLHSMAPMVARSSLKFFDVWHGIPFKGFGPEDFRLQHRYDETWVASPLLAKLYVERFGFAPEKVKVTGYARTDVLVRKDVDVPAIRARLGLDGKDVGRIILFAPTWKQDADDRSIWPFGESQGTFLAAMSALAVRTQSTFVVRAHLNSREVTHVDTKRIVWVPYASFPDTESLLLASDVLVCDWSSIAFDWLLLDRPALFLDVPAPFAKGLSVGAEYRYGLLVSNPTALFDRLAHLLADPHAYWQRSRAAHEAAKRIVYDGAAVGRAVENCLSRLRSAMALNRKA